MEICIWKMQLMMFVDKRCVGLSVSQYWENWLFIPITGWLYVLKFGYGIKLQSLENGPLYFPVKENGCGITSACLIFVNDPRNLYIYIYITKAEVESTGFLWGEFVTCRLRLKISHLWWALSIFNFLSLFIQYLPTNQSL